MNIDPLKATLNLIYEVNLVILVDLGQMKGCGYRNRMYILLVKVQERDYIGKTVNVNLDRFTGH